LSDSYRGVAKRIQGDFVLCAVCAEAEKTVTITDKVCSVRYLRYTEETAGRRAYDATFYNHMVALRQLKLTPGFLQG
jgi:hypothetical protein